MHFQVLVLGVVAFFLSSACESSNLQESGDACGGVELAGAGEIVVEDAEGECGAEQVCLSIGSGLESASPSPGQCSCRCDGPEDQGPYCECLDGFACKNLIEAVGDDNQFAGSYCVPAASDSE